MRHQPPPRRNPLSRWVLDIVLAVMALVCIGVVITRDGVAESDLSAIILVAFGASACAAC